MIRKALLLATAVGGCTGQPMAQPTRPRDPTFERECTSQHPVGTELDYSAPTDLPSITTDPPKVCEGGEPYIRIERTRGARHFATEPSSSPKGPCATFLPVHPEDATDCPVINAGA